MRQLTRPSLLGLALTSLLVSGTVWAYSVGLTGSQQVIRWNQTNLTYYTHPACSDDMPQQQCMNAVHASFQAWLGPACANVTFQHLGDSNNLKLTAIGYNGNDKNEIAFIENNQWSFGTYTLGVTAPIFYDDGTIIEADIVMNGYLQTWTATGEWNKTDIQNVLVHEIGHYFGLQHNLGPYDGDDPPTMAPKADPNLKSKTPNADDLAGLCYLQPNGSHTCTSNDDCPKVVDDGPTGEFYLGQIPCTNGYCGGQPNDVPAGDAKMGEPCVGNYDCADPLFCQSTGFNFSFIL